ncbi:MAG: chitobiase/beta-hexosaminidase C-terminal domain-containing protein [Eubacterium sp.]|nr:chitobiase/beta-hexosaminidase C-terminal domain-containing protein [Eubacterium sp.]MBQ9022609.1 chitobiase/beta-hexosaminidase C-terminal domain-containing protein [Eubacterium sp.]
MYTREEINRKVQSRKHKRRRITTVCVVLAVMIVAAVIIVSTARNHSESYLLRQANKYYAAHDYDEAIEYLDKILALNPDSADGLLLSAKINYSIKDLDSSESAVLRYLELVPNSTDGYRILLQIYTAQDRYDEILAKSREVTDKNVLAVFDEFMTEKPSTNMAGGSYNDVPEITLSSADAGDIYYTLDGTEPTTDSELFDKEEPIVIEEEGETVLSAICVDAKGRQSRVMTETYDVTLPDASAPVVSPAGGEFYKETYIHVTAEDDATIYYDWDEEPEIGGEEYYGSIRVREGNHVLQVIAVNKYGKPSDVVKYNFIYYPPAPEPEPEETTTEETQTQEQTQSTETTETSQE